MEYELYICPVVVGPFRDFIPKVFFFLIFLRCFAVSFRCFGVSFRCFVV